MTITSPGRGVVLHPDLLAEQFPALTQCGGVAHCFTSRVAGLDVARDKAEALRRLDRVHREIRSALGEGRQPFITAEQVHGRKIGVISGLKERDECFDGCDGLITNQRAVCLGIYVADCCAVFLVDSVRGAIGLVHSGKNGTELAIVGNAIAQMAAEFGSAPADLVVQLSPCIRPPHYEIDFAAQIIAQCREYGVEKVHDSGVCTACTLDRYYSYRAEKGKTGRMLAMLALV